MLNSFKLHIVTISRKMPLAFKQLFVIGMRRKVVTIEHNTVAVQFFLVRQFMAESVSLSMTTIILQYRNVGSQNLSG